MEQAIFWRDSKQNANYSSVVYNTKGRFMFGLALFFVCAFLLFF